MKMEMEMELGRPEEKLYVVNRDGKREDVRYDRMTEHIKMLCAKEPALLEVDEALLARKGIDQMIPGITTSQIDNLLAEEAACMARVSDDYIVLAGRMAIHNLHKDVAALYNARGTTDPALCPPEYDTATEKLRYSDVVKRLYENNYSGHHAPLISHEIYAFFWENDDKEESKGEGEDTGLRFYEIHNRIEDAIVHSRDYERYTYFGIMTMIRKYLNHSLETKRVLELPQHMLMTVALGIHGVDHLEDALETYELMSKGYFTHATPTLLNAGRPANQLASCYLFTMGDDSLKAIFECARRCAMISQGGGGVGFNATVLRARGSPIKRFNGVAHGVAHELLGVFNSIARYVDQCFPPGTIIHTSDGPRKIEEICAGDDVITASGSTCPVEKLLEHDYDGPILRVDMKYAIGDVLVTPTHQILALTKQAKGLNHSIIRNRLDKGISKAEMMDARELAKDDFVCFPIPKGDDVEDLPDLDCDDLRFYGLLIGDGWIGKGRNNSGLSLGLTERKASVCKFVEDYLEREGFKPTVTVREESNCVRYQWSSTHPGFKFVREQLYDETGEKIIWPRFFRLPEEKLLAIVQGIFQADGSILKECVLEMTSKPVINGVRHMLLRCGIMTSGYVRDRRGNVSPYNNITTRKISYSLRIPRVPKIMALFPDAPKGKYVNYLVHDGMMYCRVNKVTQEHYTGKVYDFEISDEHTYLSDLGAVHNGGGKRKGAFAVYLEPWHADIEEFINLRATSGNMEMKCNDLHYGLWINDLFMERVMTDGKWSLFCPTDAPELVDAYGDEFETLYLKYESEGKARKTIRAIDLWNKILDKQQEVSEPYMMYKDAVNRKSNQKNLGTIRGSNLCTEIVEYTSADEIAVCMLMSFALPRYVVLAEEHEEIERMRREYGEEEMEQICAIGETGHYYDHINLRKHVQVGVRNLNRVIDRMWYPDVAAERSNKRHRPIGIGVQGLADVFGRLEIPWDASEASQLNHDIFRTIYFSALRGSMECAKISGPYETYKGSPASKGIFQPDMWKEERTQLVAKYREKYEGEDWKMFVEPMFECETIQGTPLADEIAEHGLRNSLLVAPMPTASTAQLLGNNECFEPFTSNMYTRRTNAGDFVVYNKHLVHSLKKRGLWDTRTRNAIFMANGSIQHIDWIPDDMKAVFKTVWEIKQSLLIRMAAQRAPYIDQSMSLNLHVSTPSRATLNTLHFMSWKKKLKTGSYYIRRQAESSATSFNSVSLGASSAVISGISGISGTKRKHEEEEAEDGNGIPEASESSEEAKKARIVGACPLNSTVGDIAGDASTCDACSG